MLFYLGVAQEGAVQLLARLLLVHHHPGLNFGSLVYFGLNFYKELIKRASRTVTYTDVLESAGTMVLFFKSFIRFLFALLTSFSIT